MANPKDRVTNNLVALGSAAVFTVYAAGFVRTRPAAQRFAQQAERRPAPATRIAAATPAAESTPIDRSAAPTVSAARTAAATPATSAARTTDAKAPGQPTVADKSIVPVAVPTPKSTAARAVDHAADSAAAPPSAPTPTPTPSVSAANPAPVPVALPRDSSRTAVAQASPTAPATPVADSATGGTKEKARLKDGIFFGWGTSRHGDIQAGLEVKNGRIISAFISECLTQYSCSWIQMLPAQVIARQSPEVDFVSGATQSTNAFYYAVADALKKAK